MFVRHIRINERTTKKIEEKANKYQRAIGKLVVVLDLKGIPIFPSAAGMRIMRRHINADEAYYVESLQTLIVINAPVYFTAIWAIVKPWLDVNTLQKIRIMGSSFLSGLQEVMADDQIPTEYGGKREDFHWKYPENFDM
jgi:hypothetical protein